MDDEVTVVITSCGRPDLLSRTLASFLKSNTYPIKGIIVTEDSGIANINDEVKKEFAAVMPLITWIDGATRIGQILSIDRAYQLVKTPYLFHLEEDWEFTRSGCIEESLALLKKYPKVAAVMCRQHGDGGYFPDPQNADLLICKKGRWGYYSFNPGLRRLVDYGTVCPGGFGKHTWFDPKRPNNSELRINDLFRMRGYRMAITKDPEGYIRHIGENRHVH